jgi:hypothetical protein
VQRSTGSIDGIDHTPQNSIKVRIAMTQYFKIVNPAKRQYIDAIRFSENIKASGYMHGYHAVAVALLVCRAAEVHHRYGPLAGSWYGDPVIAASDDFGLPDQYGFTTSTETNPERNLNQMAREEFEDISYRAIAMLCQGRDGFAEEIAKKAAATRSRHLFVQLGNVVMLVGCELLEQALAQAFGQEWRKLYQREFPNYHR